MSEHDLLTSAAYLSLLLAALKVLWPEFTSAVVRITHDIESAAIYIFGSAKPLRWLRSRRAPCCWRLASVMLGSSSGACRLTAEGNGCRGTVCSEPAVCRRESVDHAARRLPARSYICSNASTIARTLLPPRPFNLASRRAAISRSSGSTSPSVRTTAAPIRVGLLFDELRQRLDQHGAHLAVSSP